MTIATRFPKSWAVPKFDIKDPSLVLYLPLWYPYSDMAVAPSGTLYSYDTNRHAGTVNGAIWTPPTGYDFDGTDDSITIPDATVLGPAQMSVECWFKPDTVTPAYQGLVIKWWDATNRAYQIYLATNTLEWDCAFTDSNTDHFVTSAAASIAIGNWYHGLGTYDGVNMRLYLNGVEIGTPLAYTGSMLTNTVQLGIGRDMRTTPASPYNGKIPEVRIYNRALTAGEVQRNYQVTRWRYQ